MTDKNAYIDRDQARAVYPWLKDRKNPMKSRVYPLTPEEEVRFILVTRLMSEYGYSPDQIDLEVEVKSGQTTLAKRADIIVFNNSKSKAPEANAYVICEVKSKDKKNGLDQLETYISQHTNADVSHGLCPECIDDSYGGQDWYEEGKHKSHFSFCS